MIAGLPAPPSERRFDAVLFRGNPASFQVAVGLLCRSATNSRAKLQQAAVGRHIARIGTSEPIVNSDWPSLYVRE